jgi:hypothetical protein
MRTMPPRVVVVEKWVPAGPPPGGIARPLAAPLGPPRRVATAGARAPTSARRPRNASGRGMQAEAPAPSPQRTRARRRSVARVATPLAPDPAAPATGAIGAGHGDECG